MIFTTAFHEHAVQAFEVNAIDYLMKPVRMQRLLSALQKVPRLKPVSAEKLAQLPASARRFLSVTERSRVVLVPLDEIVYLKAGLKYITIRTVQCRGFSHGNPARRFAVHEEAAPYGGRPEEVVF